MSAPRSRYRPGGAADYSHRFHAGNVGDVWKHCVLAEVLRRASAAGGRVAYLESHAGEGMYELAATGEWSEGIGRLWGEADGDDVVGRYVALCRRLGAGDARPERYPGSPTFARAVLGPGAELHLWERDETACARLRAHVGDDVRVRTTCGDGLAALANALGPTESHHDATVVLVDPPFTEKSDWTAVPDAVVRAARVSSRACLLLWYPVKSLTRPNAMIARLGRDGVVATVAELVTTPLEHQRHRLNGSGVLLVRPPSGTLAAIAASAPSIGERCATHAGAWSLRVQASRQRARVA